MKSCYSDKIFNVVNVMIMLVLLVVFAWPMWFVFIASFSDPNLVNVGEVLLLPKDINFNGYKLMMEYGPIWTGYANSIFYTLAGTLASMVMTICFAYPMSDSAFKPRKVLMIFFMITMYFSGGLIPTYLLLKNIHVLNTRWAMIIPGLVSVYNSLIVRSYFMNSIPRELKEASTLDGANCVQYLIKVVLPLSKPVLAVVGLFYAVDYWNNYTKALYYIYDSKLYPLQSILRELLVSTKLMEKMALDPEFMQMAYEQAQMLKYAVIIVAAFPMLLIYPFVQKFFVKGVMVGAVKG